MKMKKQTQRTKLTQYKICKKKLNKRMKRSTISLISARQKGKNAL